MKKLFAIALCLILGAALLTGCSDGSDFRQERYTASAAEVQAINIDVRDRKIEISVSQNDEIHIDYYESAKESYDFSVSDDHVLSVTAVTDKNWTDYFGGKAPAEQRVLPQRTSREGWFRYPARDRCRSGADLHRRIQKGCLPKSAWWSARQAHG